MILVVHLVLFAITLSTSCIDWSLRDRVIEIVSPYLDAIHLQVDGRPIAEVAHTDTDWQHRLEFRTADGQWQPVPDKVGMLPGSQKRLQRYLTAIGEASAGEDTATAAILAGPLVKNIFLGSSSSHGSEPLEIRVLATTYDAENRSEHQVRWHAAVISAPLMPASQPDQISFVYLEDDRLNAKGLSADHESKPQPAHE